MSHPVYFDCDEMDEEKKKKIQIYFQIRRKSGGGECAAVTGVCGRVYRVDFKDQEAQQRVLERAEHKVEMASSSVVLIVRSSSEATAPGPVSPAAPSPKHLHGSISAAGSPSGGEEHVVQVDPYLLQFLTDSAQASDELNRALRSQCATAKLRPENEAAFVRSSVHFVNDDAKKMWRSEVESIFEKMKSRYCCHFEFEAELRALLLKSCNKCQEQEEVKVYSEPELVVVVGTLTDIQAMLKHANDHHVKSRGASQKQSRKRRFDRAIYHLLHKEIEQSLAKDVPGLEVTEEDGALVFQGTAEEISKAYDIIDSKENMVKEGTVSDISKHLLAFLNQAYSCGQELGDFLGVGENVIIELMPTKIKIVSLSTNKTDQTVKTLKETFTEEQMELPQCFEMSLEQQTHLRSEEGRMNAAGLKVHVEFTKNKVTLLGHDREVKDLQAAVIQFILDQLKVEDNVQVPFPELAQKLPELLTLNGFDVTGVIFKPLHSGFVALEGPSNAVTPVRTKLGPFLQALAKLHLIVDKPGALRYFKSESGAEKLLDVANLHKCLIRLEDETTASGEEIVERYTLKKGVQVIVYLGDITKQEADALVNAANEELRHGGGVALALSKAGGPKVQRESNELIKNFGKLKTGEVVMTSGGQLKCKKILHAVGPEKQKGGEERVILEETVLAALVLAESLDFESIALPCISSGLFGVPVDVCSDAIVSAVRAFGAGEGRRLKKITLIDQRREVVQSLKAACDRLLNEAGPREEQTGGAATGGAATGGAATGGAATGGAATGAEESVRVEIIQGTLENQLVACLACPMAGAQPTSLRVGQALESVVGAALMTRFHQASGGATLPGGSVLVEGLPRLHADAVVFINLTKYSSQQQEGAKQVLREGIRSVLSTCEGRGFRSVAFPVLGPGLILQFPVSTAALILLQEIQMFEQKRASKTPFQIRIVIHPKDKEASKEFQTAQQTLHLKGFTNDARPNHASFYRHVSSSPSEVTALMGRVKMQIVQGDIIHEKCDVIVNSTRLDLVGTTAEPAGVCKAILAAAGPSVQAELRRVGPSADSICSTGAGLLGCREIVHVQTKTNAQDFNKTCKRVLKLCESKGHQSVAFPAINTGIGQMDHGAASRAMLDALAAAITELSPKSVSVIRIVILLQPVFSVFRAELDTRFGQAAPPQNLFGKWKSKFRTSRSGTNIPTTKPQPAAFSVIGHAPVDTAALKTSLEHLVHQQLLEKEFELRELSRLSEMEVAALQTNARSYGVSLDHRVRQNANASKSDVKNSADSGEKMVILSGLKEDVLVVADFVNKAVKKALSEDLQEREEESLAQTVQWMYLDNGDDWKLFNPKQNYILEEANKKQKVFEKMELNNNKVKVNLTALEATDKQTGKKYRVKRVEMDTDIDFPEKWSPMAGETFKKVELDPSTEEFQSIAKEFYRTTKHKIHKIERVQNHYLWCSYFVMRKKMLKKNGAAGLGEKHLYHGTSAKSCNCIERDRFDRNYTGTHGANYGKGVYFAVNASYSARDVYSEPDDAGLKRMYVARVLTGRYTEGEASMKAPPPRGRNLSDRYDSLVDSLQNPEMFVIFHDDQAYPEYLITFS
ncbi:protein mono-ADP-ribosyltransferase PARP14-like [Periophthalmus magnuspinnatus]|uniref:protein mono-ADP-ribosyltransferase PARP14-like n=1 Tax=Periophthalmus magnuspinnatus TaxID=409849 RepID=UPI00145B3E52|nr:protein mono-ADP-ribosyltransferase PARP14-like [Periophthalmus magnuspinnatus]